VSIDGFVLSVHILAAVVGLMMAAVLHAGLIQMSRAETVQQMRPWVPVIHRLEPLLPVAALVLLGTGIWLIAISGGEFHWTDGWILTAIVGLVAAEAVGGMVSPRSKALQPALVDEPDGPVSVELRRQAIDPPFFYGSHFATSVFLGVVAIMAAKPSGAVSALIVVVAAVIGLATAVPIVRRRPPLPAAAARNTGRVTADH